MEPISFDGQVLEKEVKKPAEPNEIAKLERAIGQRWGAPAVSVPIWDNKKESEFLEQLREKAVDLEKAEGTTFECEGFLLNKKLVNIQNVRSCPICESYLFYAEDELYINKFECCHNCYIHYVEGREEKWEERKRELLNESHKKKIEGTD